MAKKYKGITLPTKTEEQEIRKHAQKDGSHLTDQQLTEMKSIAEFPELANLSKRGRPKKTRPKQSTTIRLDPEILFFFKATGKGWQTKINDVLKKHIESNR